ncbi:MAG TPA: histidine phosphatase family protein [Pseudidiomarina sp.]|nr:histidine phosphatase family protein [Pseudidiomarina sp.]
MKRFLMLMFAVFTVGITSSQAGGIVESDAMKIQIIYVFRHAEKADTADNPSLNEQGKLRAQQLAQVLQHADIQSIFSTRYARTQQTAAPVAQQLGVTVETYAAGDAAAVINQVMQRGHTALIVGHSNTVPDIVRAAGGKAPDLTEKDYGDLFQVVVTEQGVVTNRFYID